MKSPPYRGSSAPQQPFGWTNGAGGLASVHCSALPRAYARSFEIRLHRAGPDNLADELDHVEKPALGRWRCQSLLGLPSSPQHVSGRVANLTVQERCGFKLANDGHDTRALQHYLGHKNIQHTVRYTAMAPDRFKNFWRQLPTAS
jgi:hypothetical protein